MPTPIEHTIGSGGDYADINAWVSAQAGNFTSDNKIRRGTLISNINVASEQSITGATTSYTAYWHLTANINLSSDGSGGRTISFSSSVSTGFSISDDWSIVEDFRLDGNADSLMTDVGLYIGGRGTIARRFHVHGVQQSSGATSGVRMSSYRFVKVYNGIVSNISTTSTNTATVAGIYNEGTHPKEIANCSVYDINNPYSSAGPVYGIQFSDNDNISVRGCIVGDVTTGNGSGTVSDFSQSAPSSTYVSHNTSEDSSASGTGSSTLESPTDIWTSPSTGDFSLKTGSEAIGSGRNEGIRWGINLDASGKSRQFVTSWDKGALQKETEPSAPVTAYPKDDSVYWMGSETDASVYTMNFTAGSGANRIQIVEVACEDNTVANISSIKIGTTDFTKIHAYNDGSNDTVEIWGLAESDIPSGEQTITITWDTTVYRCVATTYTLVNTDLSLTPQDTDGAGASSGVISLSVTPTLANAIIITAGMYNGASEFYYSDDDEPVINCIPEPSSFSMALIDSYFPEAPVAARTMNLTSNTASLGGNGACVVLGSVIVSGGAKALVDKSLVESNLFGGLVS